MEGKLMVDRFPLLDGTELDLDSQPDPHPDVEHDKTITLRADFAEESLPWWLSYVTDNGPANPSFAGLPTSGGLTDISLDTGATNLGDATALQGPTINWDNWTEMRAYVWGVTVNVPETRFRLSLGDNKDPNQISEGFKIGSYKDENISARVITGGTSQNGMIDQSLGGTGTHTYGFRLYESETGNGHSIDFVVNGEHRESWAENKGWPAAQDLSFHVSVVTTDGTQAIATVDGLLIELIR